MNFRLTAFLFGAVFVVGLVLLILSFSDDKETKPDVLATELAAAGVTPDKIDTVDALEFERPDGALLLVVRTDKERNVWQIQKPIVAKADPLKVQRVIAALVKAKPVPYKELRTDPAAHGLAPAGLKVTIRQGGERASSVNLGYVTSTHVFVTTSAQSKRPMAVLRADVDALFRDDAKGDTAGDLAKWTGDFRATNIFPSDAPARGQDVASIKLELPNKKKELRLSQTASGGWKIDAPFAGADADQDGDPLGSPDKFTGVSPLLSALTNVSATTFIEAPGDLKQYGLNDDYPDRVRIEMKTKDNQTVVVFLGKFEPGAAAPKMPQMPGHPPAGGGSTGTVYARIEGQPGVIRASATNNLAGLVPVITDPSQLRDRNLLVTGPRGQVDGVDLNFPGQPPEKAIKLRKVGGAWKLYGGPSDPQTANPKLVEELVAVLSAKRSIKEFPAPNPANFAAISASVFVWVDGFNPPGADPKAAPTQRAEATLLQFGRKDGETIYVRRTMSGGVVHEFAVNAAVKTETSVAPVDVLSALLKTRLDLLDRSLASFSEATPKKITVAGAGNYSIVRDDKPSPGSPNPLWRFAAPDPRAEQVADGQTARDLVYLTGILSSHIDKFVWEGDEPAKLAEYGFAPVPGLKVTVDLPPDAVGAKQVVFEFGKDASDPEKVYARQIGRAAIFTLPKADMKRLADPDLRDRAVFREVPAARVNVVEVTGWGGIPLKFQKNVAGVWESVKPPTPGAFTVDPQRVAAFVELVTRTEARTFEKSGPDPVKHGFGDPKKTIDVTLRWAADPATKSAAGDVRLVVGSETDPTGGQYYVWAAVPKPTGVVFTTDALLLKAYKDGTGAFAK